MFADIVPDVNKNYKKKRKKIVKTSKMAQSTRGKDESEVRVDYNGNFKLEQALAIRRP